MSTKNCRCSRIKNLPKKPVRDCRAVSITRIELSYGREGLFEGLNKENSSELVIVKHLVH